ASLTFVSSQKRLRNMVLVVICFSSIMAFFGTIQHLSGTDAVYGLRPASYGKPFASYLNRHHFAAFMEMTIGLTLSLLYGNATKRDKRLLLIIAIVLMGVAVILTGSRGGFLSLFTVVGFVTLFNIIYPPINHEESNEDQTLSKPFRRFLLVGSSLLLIF